MEILRVSVFLFAYLILETYLVNACYDEDMIAQSTCGGLSEKEGWVYAVRRPCKGNTTCEQICESKELSAQDPQIKDRTGRCQDSLHVYRNRPPILGGNKLGSKVYRYRSCRQRGCGPNYCCCRFT